jgi:hypothetical protein
MHCEFDVRFLRLRAVEHCKEGQTLRRTRSAPSSFFNLTEDPARDAWSPPFWALAAGFFVSGEIREITPSAERTRLLLQRLAPDLGRQLWGVGDVRQLPLAAREDIADVLGHECAERGLDADDRLNAYGRELDELADGLGLDED